jgi:hypothetical protein
MDNLLCESSHNAFCSPPKEHDLERAPVISRAASNLPPLPVSRPVLRPLSTEGSIIPGETEEDGLLRREYVLVGDTQAVEFNQAVDGEHTTHTTSRTPNPDHCRRNQRSQTSASP